MSEAIVNTATRNEIATLDSLAMQARSFIQGACMNLLQLGRVLSEAKPLVPFGSWEEWVRQNAKMSVRTAEQYMQAFGEFGLNAQIAELGTTKVFKLLPMPAEEREKLFQENDVSAMTTRQLDEAIRTQKEKLREEARREAMEEAKSAIQEANRQRDAAERRAADLAERPPEIPEELTEKMQEQQAEIERQSELNRDLMKETGELRRKNDQLEKDLAYQDTMIQKQQAKYNEMQDQLLAAQSALSRSDAERIPSDELTPERLRDAVNTFISSVGVMAYMRSTFSRLDGDRRAQYESGLAKVEAWAHDAREALNVLGAEGKVY